MAIRFEGQTIELLPDETVLEAIERNGSSLPSYCRRGVCQTCLVKATRGAVPAAAQKGLKEALRRQSLLLACVCKPSEELDVERYGSSMRHATRIERVKQISEGVLRVFVAAPSGLDYQAGQFLQLERASDGLTRPYSIASLPGEALELHVALLPGGAMSHWLRGAEGEPVFLQGPFGECFYFADEPERTLCLVGTGTGLAPLLGVLRAALSARHRGPIRLYHGSVRREGLYLWAELEALARRTPELRLVGSVLQGALDAQVEEQGDGGCPIHVAPLDATLFADGALTGSERVYLCGDQDLVRKLQKKVYLAGVPLANIHADAFVSPGARP